MIDSFLNGGPFMLTMLMLLCIIIFISVKNINEPYKTNSIVLLRILSALVGISATYIGIDAAFSSISDISKTSPQSLINGLKISLITSISGGIIMVVSTGLWYFFIRRHNLLIL